MPIPQPPTVKNRRIELGKNPLQQYQDTVRDMLAEACEELDVPPMYRPGVTNTPDLPIAVLVLALYHHLVDSGTVVELKKNARIKALKEKEDARVGESKETEKRGESTEGKSGTAVDKPKRPKASKSS